jgi:ribosome maturation factor RimP
VFGHERLRLLPYTVAVRARMSSGRTRRGWKLWGEDGQRSWEGKVVDSPLWKRIAQLVEAEGLELFDLEEPASAHGGAALRVFLAFPLQAKGEEGERRSVGFEECTRVSRVLLDVDEATPFIPEGCLLEVSSPGVNRKLRRPEHFAGAVGERVKLKFQPGDGIPNRTVLGTLKSSDGVRIVLEAASAEQGEQLIDVALENVREARVDFEF